MRTIAGLVVVCVLPLSGEITAQVRVDVAGKQHDLDHRIFGQYVEHFGRIIQGGLSAELLRNRKFYPIDPDREHTADPWNADPGRKWVGYAIDRSESINGVSSQRVFTFGATQEWRGIRQSGFDFTKGKTYIAYAWVKAAQAGGEVGFRMESAKGEVAAHAPAKLTHADWTRYEVRLTPDRDLRGAVFRIVFRSTGDYRVGAASLMPADHVDGMRPDVLALVKRMKPTIIRWPGGGYPDVYDWRKAIGDRDRRPPQDILPFGQPNGYDNGMDPNDFGTDEYLRFCERIGAQPYITANFGSGTPEMAAQWVEYTNGSASTTWGKRRAENGRAKPYGVRHWSIGNETWGPFQTGYTSAEGYATFYTPVARAMKAADPSILITAVGELHYPELKAWNLPLLERAAAEIDMLSIHHYYPGGYIPAALQERPLALYHAIAGEPMVLEHWLRELIKLVDAHTPSGRKIQIAFDEWSEWDWDREPPVETPQRSFVNQFIDTVNGTGLEFNQTMRDALFNARMLHVLMRLSDRVPIGVRTHMVNSLPAIITDQTRAFLTAPGTAMELYANHSGDLVLHSENTSPTYDLPETGWTDIAYVDSVATKSADGRKVFLHVINTHPTDAARLRIQLQNAGRVEGGQIWQVAASDFLSRNDFGVSNVTLERKPASITAPDFEQLVPPHSLMTIEVGLR